ncbi:sushi, von Willebrand factor type A, EGF and pentraxin domain-containing protein 1-like [Varanus komodoensis]|uniref:sushi, von Willebrand factor type A, EGF and pentraxin domain-containing protein 1-like n=1 Tax=Varanus komodoensis TaxID=61221 RepID=UPI001CF772C4|nr:sushi, von Willebrand factor type A, EGF and pentraxin domain-containing protein 1-like isoform X1 [Varanus komodoensis]XP_044312309.1 sushi, von Willebrand factor type A, EGF and pentraxin domain-containing protein 1-like [Varanus komodoensis]
MCPVALRTVFFVLAVRGFLSGEESEVDLDTYWSGTAPICLGGCRGKHKELKRSQCGNGSCCWLGYKSFCRVNCGRPEAEFNSMVYGNDWWVGSVVRYRCRPGFLLVGDPASACLSSGRWTPKPTCLRICLRGRIEINERDIDGSCSSTCPHKAHLGPSVNHGCIKISSCTTKQSGWTRWFFRCDFCECECYIPCESDTPDFWKPSSAPVSLPLDFKKICTQALKPTAES